MLKDLDLNRVLFLDIETVPEVYHLSSLDEKKRELWEKKAKSFREEGLSDEEIYGKAGIYAEFGKVVCISVGFLHEEGEERHCRLKSFAGHEEETVLNEFKRLLDRSFGRPGDKLCAHNGKEFDLPFLARRMLVHGIELPEMLDTPGMKPWEVPHLDTMELWKFGDRKNFTSLDLLAHIFGIPTPKDDIEGSDVARVYWEENDLNRIVEYCEKDVLTLIQLLLKFKRAPLIREENVHKVTN